MMTIWNTTPIYKKPLQFQKVIQFEEFGTHTLIKNNMLQLLNLVKNYKSMVCKIYIVWI